MQGGAGERSHYPDAAYQRRPISRRRRDGAASGAGAAQGSAADARRKPRRSRQARRHRFHAGAPRACRSCARCGTAALTSFAVELIPRISRAQSMDALSSQAAAAGYKAALLAASALDKFLPMLTTAAGTIRPAQVLVIGAGVAGLQAIATSRRLGAIVEAYDVRAATKEQIQSLGAKFVDTGVAAEGTGGYARELTDRGEARNSRRFSTGHIAKAGRRDHDGRGARAHGAAHHLEGGRGGDERRRRHRRSRRRERRQLRAHGRRRNRRHAERREDPGAAQSAVGARAARQPDVRAQPAELPRSPPSRRASSRSIGRTKYSRSPC